MAFPPARFRSRSRRRTVSRRRPCAPPRGRLEVALQSPPRCSVEAPQRLLRKPPGLQAQMTYKFIQSPSNVLLITRQPEPPRGATLGRILSVPSTSVECDVSLADRVDQRVSRSRVNLQWCHLAHPNNQRAFGPYGAPPRWGREPFGYPIYTPQQPCGRSSAPARGSSRRRPRR